MSIAEKANCFPPNWQTRLPNNSTPYTSTIVFLVRKGNPKHIKDWDDLVKPGVAVITPNPKTSGGARWSYLAAWGYALKKNNGDDKQGAGVRARLYKNVPVLDSGARGSTTTFVQRGIGDVLLSWENEAFLALNELGQGQVRNRHALHQHPGGAAGGVVDKVPPSTAPRDVAKAYSNSSTPRRARRSARRTTTVRARQTSPRSTPASFPKLKLFTIDELFGGWQKAQKTHFADGGVFDQIYTPGSIASDA